MLRLIVIVTVAGVHFKGARLFAEIDVGLCAYFDLNGIGLCSNYTMTYGIFKPLLPFKVPT